MIIVDIPIPPAPILEEALEYTGQARWIATWWEPAGDEAMIADGQTAHDSDWQSYLLLTQGYTWALAGYHLGSSDEAASEYLVIDRVERKAYVAPRREAEVLLRSQWPQPEEPVRLTSEDLKLLSQLISERMRHFRPPSLTEVHAYREKRQAAERALATWLQTNQLGRR